MFIAVMATIAKLEGAQMPFNRRMDKEDVVHIYTMEYYAAIRKAEYPTFVSTWVGLEEITLSEIIQAEGVNYMVLLTCGA